MVHFFHVDVDFFNFLLCLCFEVVLNCIICSSLSNLYYCGFFPTQHKYPNELSWK